MTYRRPAHSPARERDEQALLRTALRLAFIAGAEKDSQRRTGRPLTAVELARVLREYPGDR